MQYLAFIVLSLLSLCFVYLFYGRFYFEFMRPAIAVPWLKYEQVQDHHHDQENTSEASVGSMPLSLAGHMKSFRYERGRNNDVIVEQEQVLHKVADANGGKLSLVDRADLLSTRSELWLCPHCKLSF